MHGNTTRLNPFSSAPVQNAQYLQAKASTRGHLSVLLGASVLSYPPGALSLVYHGEALPSRGYQAPVARDKQSDHS